MHNPYRILVTQRSTVGSSAAVRRIHVASPYFLARLTNWFVMY